MLGRCGKQKRKATRSKARKPKMSENYEMPSPESLARELRGGMSEEEYQAINQEILRHLRENPWKPGDKPKKFEEFVEERRARMERGECISLISNSESECSTRAFKLGSSPIDASEVESWFESQGSGLDSSDSPLETTIIETRRGPENSGKIAHSHNQSNLPPSKKVDDFGAHSRAATYPSSKSNSPPLNTQLSVQKSAKENEKGNNGEHHLHALTKGSLKAHANNTDNGSNISHCANSSRQAAHQAVHNNTQQPNVIDTNTDTDTVKDLNIKDKTVKQQKLKHKPNSDTLLNSKRCLLPQLTSTDVNDDDNDKTITENRNNKVSNWLTQVPPLLPSELLHPPTPKKQSDKVKSSELENAHCSPLKRRRIIGSDSEEESTVSIAWVKSDASQSIADGAGGGGDMDVDAASNSSICILASASQQQQRQQQQPSQQQKQQQPSQQQHHPLFQTIRGNSKIPLLFLPKVPEIMPIISRLTSDPNIGKFKTKVTANNGLRVLASDIDSYNAIKNALFKDGIPLHTHQAKKNKGFRYVLRNLHHSTPCEKITDELNSCGFKVKFIRVIKHRFTAKPLNIFEIEIDSMPNGAHVDILKLKNLVNQAITVERQAKPRDPAQCHRCQAFGHTKNYCRRPYRCMKCAGEHASTSCAKPREDPAKCANCSEPHVSSYKGCAAFKNARSKLFAYRGYGYGRRKQQQQQQQHQQQQYHQHHHPQQQHQQSPKNAKNANNTYSWIARNGRDATNNNSQQQGKKQKESQPRQQQHQQQRANRPQQQQQSQQRRQQQPKQQQRANKTPKTPVTVVNENAIARGPAGQRLTELQQKLKTKQQQFQQNNAANPLAFALEQNSQRFERLEAKLEKLFEVILEMMRANSILGTLRPNSSSTSTISNNRDTATDADVCLYA